MNRAIADKDLLVLEETLQHAECPNIDVSVLSSANKSNAELLDVFLRSDRVEAVGLNNSRLDLTTAISLLPSLFEAQNEAHFLRLKFAKPEDRWNSSAQKEATRAARLVSEVIAGDQRLVYFAANESGLDLSHTVLVECGLLDSLKVTRSLCYLLLRGVGLDAKGAVLLGHTMAHQGTIKLLEISSNAVGDRGIVGIANSLNTNKTLRFLCLGDCNVSSVGACALAKALETNRTLDLLCLSDDDLGAASGRAFASMLKKNSSLRRLHLDYCDLKPEGCKAFVEALRKNRTLKHLTLNHSGICFHDKVELVRLAKEFQVLEILQVEDRNELTIPIGSPSRYTLSTNYPYLYSFDTNYARHVASLNRQRAQEPPAKIP